MVCDLVIPPLLVLSPTNRGCRFKTRVVGAIPVGDNTNRGAGFTIGEGKVPAAISGMRYVITKIFSNFSSLSFQNPDFFAYLVWFAEC
jgi:hypothetical protein